MHIKQILKDIDELIKSLDENLLRYRLSYVKFLNIIPRIPSPGKEKDLKFCLDSLDSIGYRVGSISYHLGLLRKIDKGMTEQLLKDFFSVDKKDSQSYLMIYGSDIQRFIFDDIVFNLMSLFDYIGSLFWFSLSGKRGRCIQWSKAWEKTKKAISGKGKAGNIKPEDLMVCKLILKFHQDLVNDIAQYRGKLIHFKKDRTQSQILTDLSDIRRSKFIVFAPVEFINKFEELVNLSKKRDLTLVETVAWIIKESLTAVNEILSALQKKIIISEK